MATARRPDDRPDEGLLHPCGGCSGEHEEYPTHVHANALVQAVCERDRPALECPDEVLIRVGVELKRHLRIDELDRFLCTGVGGSTACPR